MNELDPSVSTYINIKTMAMKRQSETYIHCIIISFETQNVFLRCVKHIHQNFVNQLYLNKTFKMKKQKSKDFKNKLDIHVKKQKTNIYSSTA